MRPATNAGGWDPAPVLALMPPWSTSDDIGARLGVSGCAVRGWRKGRSRISFGLADRIALELGRHPVNLWPTWPEPVRNQEA